LHFALCIQYFALENDMTLAASRSMKMPLGLFVALTLNLALPLRMATAEKPNVVYILADDLGYGDVQCLNPRRGRIATPHLDRLASQGMSFTDAHSGSSVCTPTRYGLLTGRYAWRTRLQRGVLDGGNDPSLIEEDRLTVQGLLQEHGYTTACIGKWHLGFQSDIPPRSTGGQRGMGYAGLPIGAKLIDGPTTRGFGEFWGCSNARTMASLIEGDRVVELLPPTQMLPRLTLRAVQFIDDHAERAKSGTPFFLYVPLTSPHTPIVPSRDWQGKSPLGPYGDFVMQTDDTVGQILAALDRHSLAENTLVVFTSDNGCSPQAGTEKLEELGHYASARFRGYKSDLWDGGHRVPFLVRRPGLVQPGSECDEIICLTDFLATVAELLDVELPDDSAPDSVSFLPALRGKPIVSEREAIVHHSISGRFGIRDGKWKLNLCAGSGGWIHPREDAAEQMGLPRSQLYDLDADPGETNNLIDAEPDKAERLTALLRRYIDEGRSTPGPKLDNDVKVDFALSSRLQQAAIRLAEVLKTGEMFDPQADAELIGALQQTVWEVVVDHPQPETVRRLTTMLEELRTGDRTALPRAAKEK
jgi:arylsulfatase A-like enzyme